jgi:hypothetical protein
MNIEPQMVESTVLFIVDELTRNGIRYAVLRNYENLPRLEHGDGSGDLTDIDLVVSSEDLPQWREVTKAAAERLGWEVVTECDHWTQSAARSHHIEVFRFYSLSPLRFIQIDIFHAFVVLGVPLMNERDLLEGGHSNEMGIVCMDPAKENAQRLVKIRSLIRSKSKRAKFQRYRSRVLMFWSRDRELFERTLHDLFGSAAIRALHALKNENVSSYLFWMKLARIVGFLRFFCSHPQSAIKHIVSRFPENRKRFVTRTCGRIVRVHVPDSANQGLVRRVLNELCTIGAFENWKEKSVGSPISAKHRSVMEQGGLVIEWSDLASADLIIPQSSQEHDVRRQFINTLVAQDNVLFPVSEGIRPNQDPDCTFLLASR